MSLKSHCVLFAFLAAGCGGGQYSFAPVEGKVTLNDQPVSGASVEFQPVGGKGSSEPGPGSIGLTDAQGKFKLHSQLDLDQAGAVVGKHRVRIYVYPPATSGVERDADASPKPKKPAKGVVTIPDRYGGKSDVTFEVPAGGKLDVHFDLKSP
jgi:hypothetical protein